MVPGVDDFRPEADMAVLDSSGDADDTLYADRFYLVAESSRTAIRMRMWPQSRRYLQHPLNLYFLLFEQKRVRVEVRARAAEWKSIELTGLDAQLELPVWDFRVRLADLYEGTQLRVPV